MLTLGVMVGYPGDTLSDALCTVDFVRSLRSTYVQRVKDQASGPGFVICPFEVHLPRHSRAWESRHIFAEKGLEIVDEDLFGDNLVKNASRQLKQSDIRNIIGALLRLGIAPAAETRIKAAKGNKIDVAGKFAQRLVSPHLG